MNDVPLVTVLIPARNEAGDIAQCLDAILAQDYPHDRLEIVVVDGGSTDTTAAVVAASLTPSDVAWRVVTNVRGDTPSNLNRGLAAASGSVVCRVDARSLVPPLYVSRCVAVLNGRPDVSVVGGAQVAIARGSDLRSVSIARALNNRRAMGGARYRAEAESGETDTVYLGAFRTDDLRRVNGWDERFATNQDFDLNRRLSIYGLVWFESGIPVGYMPRQSVSRLISQYHRFGQWKVRYWRMTNSAPLRRQRALLAVPIVGAVVGGSMLVVLPNRVRLWAVATMAIAGPLSVDRVGHAGQAGNMPGVPARWLAGVINGLVGLAWFIGIGHEAAQAKR